MARSGLVELEAVAAVARRGSFRAAAIELGLSTSALSHTIAALEGRLGVRLFNRTTRSVALTAAGEQFVAQVTPALAQIRGAMEAVDSHRDTPAGVLRINTSVGAARMVMTPLILEFLRRYPEMRLDLVTEDRLIDIVAEGFDAGIRRAETIPRDMIAVPIAGDLRSLVVGAPAYFADHPPPQSPADLAGHECIRARLPSGVIYRWEFERHGETLTLDAPGRLILDDAALMLEAARAGLGLTYLSEWWLADDLADGRLVPVLEAWTPPYPGLQLYYPAGRHPPAGLRAFVALIREMRSRR